MAYSLFLLVLIELIINWLYKQEDKTKTILTLITYSMMLVLSALGIILGTSSVILYIYYSLLLLTSLSRIILDKRVISFFIKNEKAQQGVEKARPIVSLCSLYINVLATIMGLCVVWQSLTYIIIAIVILLVLIVVHEFGHYIAGKLLGFKINEFSVGFGPAILQKTKKDGEKLSLRVLPLGGYCAFEGEDEENPHPGAFNNQKPWKRFIVLSAGVVANFIFGIITSIVYLSMASYALPQVVMIQDGNTNPFMVGDVITEVNGNKLNYYRASSSTFEQFANLTAKFEEGEEFVVTVIRDNKELDLKVKKEVRPATRYITNIQGLYGKLYLKEGDNFVLIANEDLNGFMSNMENKLDNVYQKLEVDGNVSYELISKEDIFSLGGIAESTAGVSLGIFQTYKYYDYTFGQALLYAVPFGVDICWLILKVLGGIFTGATAVKDLGGTITSVDAIAQLASVDLRYIAYLVPMIAMNLAVFNALPIPALDGAKMVFVGIEMVRKKPINRNVEAYIHFVGLLALLALVVFLDVYHFFIL